MAKKKRFGIKVPRILKSVARVATAPIKGVTHGVLETGRGVITMNPGRVLAAPLKGVTHGSLEMLRGKWDITKQTSGGFAQAMGWGPWKKKKPASGGSTTPPKNPPIPGTQNPNEESRSMLVPALLIGGGVLTVFMIAKGKG